MEPGADVVTVVAELNLALRTHGGGVEHVETTAEGVVRLRMLGLCAGCLYRPLTMAGTIQPLFAQRTGMKVELLGARISAEAEERIARALARSDGLAGHLEAMPVNRPVVSAEN